MSNLRMRPLTVELWKVDASEDGTLIYLLLMARWNAHEKTVQVLWECPFDKRTPLESYVHSFFNEGDNAGKDHAPMRKEVSHVVDAVVWPCIEGKFEDQNTDIQAEWIFTVHSLSETLMDIRVEDPMVMNTPEYMETLQLAENIIPTVGELYSPRDYLILDMFATERRCPAIVSLRGRPPTILHTVSAINLRLHPTESLHQISAMYSEINTLRRMPEHPGVTTPPIAYLTRVHKRKKYICGYFLEHTKGRCLGDIIGFIPTRLARRRKWARQICEAVWHIHNAGKTFHGDICLSNVVLESGDNTVLVDFEQFRASASHIPPEASGDWDHGVSEAEEGEEEGSIFYRRFEGTRPEGWSSYREWQHMPEVIESMEVYALGVTLWSLFNDPASTKMEEEEPLPQETWDIISQCLETNPTQRVRLEDVYLHFSPPETVVSMISTKMADIGQLWKSMWGS